MAEFFPSDFPSMPQEPPTVSRMNTNPCHGEAHKLSALIAEAKARKTIKAAGLDRFRVVLLKERKTRTSVRILAESLAKMGVVVSEETLRLWVVRQEERQPFQKKPSRIPATKPTASTTTHGDVIAGAAVGPRVARADI